VKDFFRKHLVLWTRFLIDGGGQINQTSIYKIKISLQFSDWPQEESHAEESHY
jgi:hypothetical protein